MTKTGRVEALRGDIFGGITAAVVALPLALAFGVASGLGPMAGIYGAIATGFFAAVFGGTPAQVSGPTGPMTVVMAAVVAQHADRLETAFAIVFLGGLFQVLFGAMRVGRFVSYTPYSVISGFMSGVGVIIILLQLLPFLGASATSGGPMGAVRAFPSAMAMANLDAMMIGAASLATMLLWPPALGRVIPAPLAALLIGALLGATYATGAPTIGAVPVGLPDFVVPTFAGSDVATIVQPAFVLALLGTIDSLLTSLVADSITHTHHNSNKELVGQGLGNMAAALLGALPGAGATMRTVVNVRAGGRTRFSGALHAMLLLGLVLGLGPLAENIPNAALAGILLKVGWDIIDWGYLRRVHRAPRDKVIVMFITLTLTVFVDLVTAVAVGIILASFVTARWMETEEVRGITAISLDTDATLSEAERAALVRLHGDVLVVNLRGRFSYASAREITRRLGGMTAGYKVMILDLTDAAHVDTSAAMAIEEVIEGLHARGVRCLIAGLSGVAASTLDALGTLDNLSPEDCQLDRARAIARAEALLQVEERTP